jgi:hypothetical protein
VRSRTSSSNTTRILLGRDGNIYFGTLPPAPAPEKSDPRHDGGSFGVVWVNDVGRDSMLSGSPAKFPAGSVIVREKFAGSNDTQPQLLAVMIKRAVGFNSKGGDWEYFVVDGGMKKIRERQKKGNCSGCHSAQKERDFVFPSPVK